MPLPRSGEGSRPRLPRRQLALRTLLALVALVPVGPVRAAHRGAAVPAPPPLNLTLGSSQAQFTMPSGWMVRTHPRGWVLSGPEGLNTYYTTITLQEVPQQQALDAVVDASLAILLALPNFTWIYRDLVVVGTGIGIHDTALFELHETTRYQSTVTLSGHGQVLSLTYLAPIEHAAEGLPVFYDLLSSLTLGANLL